MAKLWAGRNKGETDALADIFNSSIAFDQRMYREDISGSKAHASMLSRCGIIGEDEAEEIVRGLDEILKELDEGTLVPDPAAEDIHMFIEEELTGRIGESGKKLHTARSRNDQVALDLRLWLRGESEELMGLIRELRQTLAGLALEHIDLIMPGYTHLQRAQPILFSHHLMAYACMLIRDSERLKDMTGRMNVSPIGACALAGTSYPTDREYEAGLLGLDEVSLNSLDAVSDRDFCLELLSDLAILMMHLSRLSEELILWSSAEFHFIELDDAYTTGSSIMPQKKNPDMAELIRGKTGRVYGDMIGLFTVMKALPLAYDKDMQEDKEAVFDAVDTAGMCLRLMTAMLSTMRVLPERMLAAAEGGFINATDLADYLVGKGLAFRDAYRAAGEAVRRCLELGVTLTQLPIEEYRAINIHIDDNVYEAIDLAACVARRTSQGGTSKENVLREIEYVKSYD